MKPHEETWRVYNGHSGQDSVALDGTSDIILEDVGWNEGRVRLAAQAPAMARLLLLGMTVTAAAEENHETCLAGCGGWGPTPEEHGKGCELVAVLRAAGVIE